MYLTIYHIELSHFDEKTCISSTQVFCTMQITLFNWEETYFSGSNRRQCSFLKILYNWLDIYGYTRIQHFLSFSLTLNGPEKDWLGSSVNKLTITFNRGNNHVTQERKIFNLTQFMNWNTKVSFIIFAVDNFNKFSYSRGTDVLSL